MTGPALLAFLGIVVLFILVSWYVVSRLNIIRLPDDPTPKVLTLYVLSSTVVIVLTLLFLVRP